MKRIIGMLFATALMAPAPALAEGFGPLVSAAELAETDAPLLIDIRAEDSFEAGHVEGSVNAPYALFRGPKENPGALVSVESLEQTLRGIGARQDRPTVVVYQGRDITDFGAAARVYWTLKSSGFTDLAILNGGVNAWTGAGLPLEEGAVSPTPSDIEISFSDEWLATTDQVRAVVDGKASALLVDARPEEFWSGEKMHPAADRPGTLPHSNYFPHSTWFGGGSTEISQSERVRQLATDAGYTGEQEIVSFCNTGHWAATNWFAMSELAGIDGVKLYPESMVGYSNAGYDMWNTPSLLENLIGQVTGN